MKVKLIMKPSALIAAALAIAGVTCLPVAEGQLFILNTDPNGASIKVCGIPGAPGAAACVGGTNVKLNDMGGAGSVSVVVAAELADVRQQLLSLQGEIKDLKQSNEDTAKAVQAAAQTMQTEDTKLNQKFTDALITKLNNYGADFVDSPAYRKLKDELTKMIKDQLGTAPAAPPPPAPTGAAAMVNPQPQPIATAPDALRSIPEPAGTQKKSAVATKQDSGAVSNTAPVSLVARASETKE